MNKEEDAWKAWLEWAEELLQYALIDFESPHIYEATIHRFARKLKSDVEDAIVPEWFCSDCDYQRRYGR